MSERLFYKFLDKNNIRDVLEPVTYKDPDYVNETVIFDVLQEIVSKNASVLVYGDYDVDGLMCAKGASEALRNLGCTKVEIFNYVSRTHNLDRHFVYKCVQEKFEYAIICDTASSELDALKQLSAVGIKVVVLDHHNTKCRYQDYPENCSVINTILENRSLKQDKFAFSAGALVWSVFHKFSKERFNKEFPYLAMYALISLYADCMDMYNELNRSVYWYVNELSSAEMSKASTVLRFMNEYTVFGRRFIDFWFSPRINACFRSENFDLLNALFFKENDNETMSRLVEQISEVYEIYRELIKTISDSLEITELQKFTVCDLNQLTSEYDINKLKLYNYTGLIANKLSDKYNKPAIVTCSVDSMYKGSFRDRVGNDYLSVFQQICDANGHKSAFGFYFALFDYNEFMRNLEFLDKRLGMNNIITGSIIIEYEVPEPSCTVIEDMGIYNDFSGGKLPVLYVKKQKIGYMKEIYSQYNYKYKWGDYIIQSDYPLDFGTEIIAKPVKRQAVTLIA